MIIYSDLISRNEVIRKDSREKVVWRVLSISLMLNNLIKATRRDKKTRSIKSRNKVDVECERHDTTRHIVFATAPRLIHAWLQARLLDPRNRADAWTASNQANTFSATSLPFSHHLPHVAHHSTSNTKHFLTHRQSTQPLTLC